MGNNISFYERQYFRQWWLIILLVAVGGIFIFGCIQQLIIEKAWGNNPISDGGLIFLTTSMLLFIVWFFCMHLDTEIDKEGISWRFFLLEFRTHFLSWDEIDNAEVITYDPMQFGGWGIRSGTLCAIRIKSHKGNFFRKTKHADYNKTKVYNVSGKKALLLELTNGKKILIGTRKPEELSEILTQLHAQRNKK
jgi:hypothetical protein